VATLVQAGLPPGAAVLVQDNLRQRAGGGAQRPFVSRAASVPASGVLVVTDLPDSNYSLFFTRPALLGHSIPSIDVGDRAAYIAAGRRRVPPPVVLVSAGVYGHLVFLAWRIRAGGWNAARYLVEGSTNGGSSWFAVADVANPEARDLTLDTLTNSTTYLLRVKALNADGRCMGPSNSRSVTVGKDPAIPATLDAMADGTTYGRVRKAALDAAGLIDLAAAGIVNRGALALLNTVKSSDIAKDAVTSTAILDGAVVQAKIAALAVGTSQLANTCVTATKIGASAVGSGQLASTAASLTKVSGGILTGSGSTATLPSGKILDATAGTAKLKTFTAMPTVGEVADGEWFAVSAGASKGIYVRSGTVAFNGAGIESSFSS